VMNMCLEAVSSSKGYFEHHRTEFAQGVRISIVPGGEKVRSFEAVLLTLKVPKPLRNHDLGEGG